MGAVFAAAARAPITAVIIIFELTGDYQIILPLMFAVVLATGSASSLTRDTIYTLKLRRRGIDIEAPRAPGDGPDPVAEAMDQTPRGVQRASSQHQIIARFATERSDSLPVTAVGGRPPG